MNNATRIEFDENTWHLDQWNYPAQALHGAMTAKATDDKREELNYVLLHENGDVVGSNGLVLYLAKTGVQSHESILIHIKGTIPENAYTCTLRRAVTPNLPVNQSQKRLLNSTLTINCFDYEGNLINVLVAKIMDIDLGVLNRYPETLPSVETQIDQQIVLNASDLEKMTTALRCNFIRMTRSTKNKAIVCRPAFSHSKEQMEELFTIMPIRAQ